MNRRIEVARLRAAWTGLALEANMKSSRPLLSSIGFEVAATVAGGALVGYWVDRHFKSAPWGLLIGSVLGLFAGLYNLVRVALRVNRGTDAGSPRSPGRISGSGGDDGPAKR